MRFKRYVIAACLLGTVFFAVRAQAEDTMSFGDFGTMHLYQATQNPDKVVLFFSGDGGWNPGAINMAKALAGWGALVIGIDTPHYLKRIATDKLACTDVAGDFELLSQYIQKRAGMKVYHTPLLIGYSFGATLVYAALAQAPAGTFAGAISLNFSPDLPLGKPFCKEQGLLANRLKAGKGYAFKPASRLAMPWIVLQGDMHQMFKASAADIFVSHIAGAEIVHLGKVGHDFAVQENWLAQFTLAYTEINHQYEMRKQQAMIKQIRVSDREIMDLPIIEMQAQTTHPSDELVMMFTGDGGWTSIDRRISTALASQGVSVVGLNSLRYFWQAKSPKEAAADVGDIIRYYLAAWHKKKVILLGYSFGADVAPFIYNRLSLDVKKRVGLLVLLEPEAKASFEFTLGHWLNLTDEGYPVRPEILRVHNHLLCIYTQASERDSPCTGIAEGQSGLQSLKLPGGDHFNGHYKHIVAEILRKIHSDS